MHYCQSCDVPTVMEPDDGAAVCPACGRRDETARLQPVFLVTGASGSGKTAVFGPLAKLLARRCAVFDVDWLLDAAGALSGAETVAELPWPGFDQAWLSVAHGVAQSGLPTLLLGPLTPERLEHNSGRRWVGQIHSLNLDCPDDVRRRRIGDRPRWRMRDVVEQIAFARWLRENMPASVDTSTCSVEEAAQRVAGWVVGHLG
jgi:hypothetical protein